jgi:hypothetical protein
MLSSSLTGDFKSVPCIQVGSTVYAHSYVGQSSVKESP